MRARVERLGEPALLLLLADGPTHGYQLLEQLPDLVGDERVDVGNVYRALRGLEDEGLVVSEWSADLPGPAKRTYTLTDDGRAVLDAWHASLAELRGSLTSLLDQWPRGGEHVRTRTTPSVDEARSQP